MSTYISGGSRSGKSYLAQRIARAGGTPLYYVATMIPRDDEDRARIERHRRERAGWGFETLERGADVLACLDAADARGSFLLDSVTALLANAMFPPDGFRADAGDAVADMLCAFVCRAPKTVMVSDFIFCDAALYAPETEAFRRALADIDRRLARVCDNVLEVALGQVVVHKGGLPL